MTRRCQDVTPCDAIDEPAACRAGVPGDAVRSTNGVHMTRHRTAVAPLAAAALLAGTGAAPRPAFLPPPPPPPPRRRRPPPAPPLPSRPRSRPRRRDRRDGDLPLPG